MQSSPVILDLCLRKTPSGKSHDYRDASIFEKLRLVWRTFLKAPSTLHWRNLKTQLNFYGKIASIYSKICDPKEGALSLVKPADRIAREQDASTKRKTWLGRRWDPVNSLKEESRTGPEQESSTWNGKLGHSWLWDTEKMHRLWIIAERHLSGWVKISPGECVLRFTGLNGKFCQNLVSNTLNRSCILFLTKHQGHVSS